MKQEYIYFFVASLLFALLGCSKKQEAPLLYLEQDFSLTLSCVDAANSSPAIFYAGLENGDIVRLDLVSNERLRIHAGYNRVYDILEQIEGNDTILWAGLRDEGLVRLTGSNYSRLKKYSIPHPDGVVPLTSSYAPYKIANAGDSMLYLATSCGIYRLHLQHTEDSVLELFYRPAAHKYYNFGVNQIALVGGNVYAATSDSGLVVIDIRSRVSKRLIANNSVLHFFHADNLLLATAADTVYSINTAKNSIVAKTANRQRNNFASINDPHGGVWTLTASEMKYQKMEDRASIALNEKLSSNRKNLSCFTHDFVAVACGKHLYLFPMHQNSKGAANNVVAACLNKDKDCYFVTLDNKLYKADNDDKLLQSQFISRIDIAPHLPRKMISDGNKLWLMTDNSLFSIDCSTGKTEFEIGVRNSGANIELGATIDFRSIYHRNNYLYLGTSYYLYRFYPDSRKLDSIPTAEAIQYRYDDLYVTDIASPDEDSLCYFATLNKGIFCLDNGDSLRHLPGSENLLQVRCFAFLQKDPEDSSYVFTSNGLYRWKRNTSIFEEMQNFNPKTVSAVYHYYPDFYIVGWRGWKKDTKIRETGRWNDIDISINEGAVAGSKGGETLFVGAHTGLYKIQGSNMVPVTIDTPEDEGIDSSLILALALILLVAVFAFYLLLGWYKRIRSNCKNRLQRCINKVLLAEEQQQLDTLKLRYERLKPYHLFSNAALKNEIKQFEEQLDGNRSQRIEQVQNDNKERLDMIDSKLAQLRQDTVSPSKIQDIERLEERRASLQFTDTNETLALLHDISRLESDSHLTEQKHAASFSFEPEKFSEIKPEVDEKFDELARKFDETVRTIKVIDKEIADIKKTNPQNEVLKALTKTKKEHQTVLTDKCINLFENYNDHFRVLKLKANSDKWIILMLYMAKAAAPDDVTLATGIEYVSQVKYKLRKALENSGYQSKFWERFMRNAEGFASK